MSRNRMTEFQFLGMQIEPVGCMSVERIPHDGSIQSQGMGSMYPELVRPPGQGVKSNPGMSCRILPHHLIAGHGRLAIFLTYQLTRTIIRVGT